MQTTTLKLSLLASTAALALSGCASTSTPAELPTIIELSTEATDSESLSESNDGFIAKPDQPDKEGDSETAAAEQTDSTESSASDLDYVRDYAELEIDDQMGDGTSVQIREIETSLQAGLIVIFDSTGSYLGEAIVSSTVQPVSIELATPIASSQELVAQLFSDNGNGVFDSKDLQVIESEDNEIEIIDEDFEYEIN